MLQHVIEIKGSNTLFPTVKSPEYLWCFKHFFFWSNHDLAVDL